MSGQASLNVTALLDATAVDDLSSRFRGRLVSPGDEGYDEARRVWNGSIDKYPALIAGCTGVADVCAAVRFAREHELLAAVRGGGHSIPGHSVCGGGLVIDLSLMKGIRVDPSTRTARAQAGLTWGEFDRETALFGLATTGGQISTTGIAGLTLGGGVGWLMRKYGLTCDNLISVDLVTADGEVTTASADENSELFWGVRGGGGNFGIVTSFEYRLHAVSTVLGGFVVHPLARAQELLGLYRDLAADAPDELTMFAVLFTAPPQPPFPAHLQGRPVAALAPTFAGDLDEDERVLRPLRSFGPPELDLVGPMPYVAVQSMLDETAPPGLQHYPKSDLLAGLSDEAVETIVDHAARMTSPLSQVILATMGGAVSRVGEGETAFPHREAPFLYIAAPFWTERAESDVHVAWAQAFWEAMRPFARGTYVNFLTEEGEPRVKAAYGQNAYDRLLALKRKYDPDNFFRLNQNISP